MPALLLRRALRALSSRFGLAQVVPCLLARCEHSVSVSQRTRVLELIDGYEESLSGAPNGVTTKPAPVDVRERLVNHGELIDSCGVPLLSPSKKIAFGLVWTDPLCERSGLDFVLQLCLAVFSGVIAAIENNVFGVPGFAVGALVIVGTRDA
jgi:hypothetical protein